LLLLALPARKPSVSPADDHEKAGAMNEPVPTDASLGPARPRRLTVEFYEESDALVIHKKRGGGPWPFLLLWLIGWTVGCVFLLVNVLRDPNLGNLAIGLPFWASWLFVACLMIWTMFGKETFLLSRDEAAFRRTTLVRLSSRVVPREEIQTFRECRSSHTENDRYLWGIEMLTLGKPVRFAFRLPDLERAWLIHRLNQFLTKSPPSQERLVVQSAVTLSHHTSTGDYSVAGKTHVATEVLAFETTLAEPPTDRNWHVTDDPDTFEFRQRGRLNIGPLAVLLCINAFWNGIVSVFVMVLFGLMPGNNAPQGGEWWGLLVFLIPFEVIGLGMFAALVITMLEPWRTTTWRFESERIVSRLRWPVFSYTRTWDVIRLDRLELRRRNSNDSRGLRFSKATTDTTAETPFELALVSGENVDLCEIDDLTEGEARWMARIILDRRGKWFSKSPGF
jgi:hypothetical protein